MSSRRTRGGLLVSIFLPAALVATTAWSQAATTFQTLDRIGVYSSGNAIEMAFDKPGAKLPYDEYLATSTIRFQACTLTATDGLYCLDGNDVRWWPSPLEQDPDNGKTLFSCLNQGLELRGCTGLTVDRDGAIWLAGQNKRKTYDLVKVIDASDPKLDQTCPTSWVPVTGRPYKACSWATGRPLLVDITSIGGEAADLFSPKAGIIGLEERKTVTFFPADGSQPYPLGSGKSDWGLIGNEQLQAVTVLPAADQVLVTTDKGRLLRRTAAGGLLLARDLPKEAAAAGCDASGLTASYGIRSSYKTDFVYVTDRTRCWTYAFNPNLDGNWTTDDWSYLGKLSTAPYAPEGPTIAPGIGIDMRDCDPECQPVQGAFLKIPYETLASTESGLTLFQVVAIPDCRWKHDPDGSGPVLPPGCPTDETELAKLIVDPDGTGAPAAQYLNIRPLLPEDVQLALAASGIPSDRALLVSPAYRGQLLDRTKDDVDNPYYQFDAFFGITDPNVQFVGTFELEFFVDELITGARIPNYDGCVLAKDLPPSFDPTDPDEGLSKLLRWDVMTKLSETRLNADGQQYRKGDGQYFDTLINYDCGSSRGASFGWSMVAYNLEPTPDTYDAETGVICKDNDAVFARLLDKLYQDLVAVTEDFACSPAGSSPIDAATCSTLQAQLANGADKLEKCILATYQPKTSSGNQNCQSFLSQFSSVTSTIAGTLDPWYVSVDPDNRRGELLARVKVIQHVYDDKFVPSIPRGGFSKEATQACQAP